MPTMMRAGLLATLLPFFAIPGKAQNSSSTQESEYMRRQEEQMQREMRKQQARQLEDLKKKSPEAYALQVQALKRQEEVKAIIIRVNKGELSKEQAKRELFPLVKQEVRPQLDTLNNRISRLGKKLAFLERVRKDPNLLIQRQVELILGERKADDNDIPW